MKQEELFKLDTTEPIKDVAALPKGVTDKLEPFESVDPYNPLIATSPQQYMEQVKRGLVYIGSVNVNPTQFISLQVLGEPTAQKRHRSVRMGKFNRQYDPSAADKGDFLSIVQKHAPETPHAIPLQLDLRFYFTRPKAHYKSGKNAHLLKDNPPEYHTSRPDCDNLCKFVMDALNKIYWKDDSYIVSLTVQKLYSENPRTEIELTII